MKQEVTLSRDDLTLWFAKAMAFSTIGDPNALDIKGEPRWKWYLPTAMRFVGIYGYLLFPKGETDGTQGRDQAE